MVQRLDDEERRKRYDAGGFARGGGQFDSENFDYGKFFTKFDAAMRRHHEQHATAVRDMIQQVSK